VLFIGTTNLKGSLDTALWRRIDLKLRVPAPDEEGRLQILKVHTAKRPLGKDVDLAEVARRARGFTGADIQLLAEGASSAAFLRLAAAGDKAQGKTAQKEQDVAATSEYEAARARISNVF